MEAWRTRLVAEVPREEIPRFLEDLQALVALLRRHREDLVVPEPGTVRPLLTEALRRHGDLVVAYLDDARYRDVVATALQAERDETD